MGLVNIIFNGEKIQSDNSLTILDLAKQRGVEIPTLCHDERLAPYGSCFLCVVDVKRAKTLMPACATKLTEGMEIETDNETVRSARKTALELILSAHSGDCLAPCKIACPAGCDIQGYVGLIANSNYSDAIKLIKETIPFPASIGRVCPKFCEDKCRRQYVEESVSICSLKRFVADNDLNSGKPYMPELLPKIGKKVAVIGGGPAGLSAAYYLVRNGVETGIFEAKPKLGGMLRYGIPQYRLPKEVLDRELETITGVGMEVHTGKVLGKDFTIDSLKKDGFDAILLAMGAWKSQSMRIPNEEASNVFNGIKFLERVSEHENIGLHGRVAIVGGGNTAFDCARTAVRLGASEVVMIYRRTKDEMPAEEIEKIEAAEEGVKFMFLTAPVEVIKNGDSAKGLVLRKMKLGEPDSSGRRSPVPIEGSDFNENFDFIISAIGQGPDFGILGDIKDKLVKDGKRLSYNKETCQTGIEYVFAAGDYSIGAATVVEGIAEAKKAALFIVKYLKGEDMKPANEYYSAREELTDRNNVYFSDWEKSGREKPVVLSPEIRKSGFTEIEEVFAKNRAASEAKRCMECGCMDVYECSLKRYSEEYEAVENKFKGALNIFKNDDTGKFLFREPSKCILCGRCVRLCSEKVNVGVYGYVKRGFESIVAPSFGFPLSGSDCINCGTCISGCPVGAIVPKQPDRKKVPLKTKRADAYCFYCSNGCKTTVSVLDGSIYEIKEREGYLCEKGRFHFPVVSKNGFDLHAIIGYKDATVYPSASLSSEDYEALKSISTGLNWKLANYYSQSSLWQAFAALKKLPSMDFFNSEAGDRTLFVVAGDLEKTNPVAINRLNELRKGSQVVIHLNNERTLRLKNLGAVNMKPGVEIRNLVNGKSDIIFLVNPVDFDLANGKDSSLNLYNEMIGTGLRLRTTLFSSRKNIYSFYDSVKASAGDSKYKIYINTFPDSGTFPSITVTENGREILRLPFDPVQGNCGTYLNSRNQYYRNKAVFETGSILEASGIGEMHLLKYDNMKNESVLEDKYEPSFFPEK
jgi:formate dehydrogenase major subunit